MEGPCRQFAIAELGQNLPDRTLVERDTEAPLQFVAQIDPPPTHDPVHRAARAGLDKLGQFGLLPPRQFRSGPWGFEIPNPAQSLGAVTVPPTPHHPTVPPPAFH